MLAERYGRKDRDKVFRVNVAGTRNMLVAAKDNGVEAFVWTGSCTAVTDDMKYQYPNVDERWPTSNHSLIYGESKVGVFTSPNETNAEKLIMTRQPPKPSYSRLLMRSSLHVHCGPLYYLVPGITNSFHPFMRALLKARPRGSSAVATTCGMRLM